MGISTPFFSHDIVGSGNPSDSHINIVLMFTVAATSVAPSSIVGGTTIKRKRRSEYLLLDNIFKLLKRGQETLYKRLAVSYQIWNKCPKHMVKYLEFQV